MYDIIVIGAGPAGMTAALYARRAGKKVLLLEKEYPGGQIVNSPLVENYPALPNVSGAEFAEKLQQQIADLGVEIEYREAETLEKKDGFFTVNGSEALQAKTVILATGVSHRGLGLPGEEELVGLGISYCAVCDGAFYRGRDAAVIGGGDTALQDAIYLSALCRTVYVIHRRESFRAASVLVEKAGQKGNIVFKTPCIPREYLSDDNGVTGLVLENAKNGSRETLNVDGIFLAVGLAPQNDFARSLVSLSEQGYLMASDDVVTEVPGLFAAGDCRVKKVRQLTTAVGDGAMAATAACEYLDER
ncbi:MAG: FAD-dependent oxidoreductase [Lachnospiraceae bacterium]|nr:FAD-dependent oxidoreductase [Lachnospiraceae bacterium]